jgi:hypothetical protein
MTDQYGSPATSMQVMEVQHKSGLPATAFLRLVGHAKLVNGSLKVRRLAKWQGVVCAVGEIVSWYERRHCLDRLSFFIAL